MAVPAVTSTSFSWSRALAAISFLAAAWAAVQVGFLISALTDGPPSSGSRLVFEYRDNMFIYYLIFHAVAIIVFGAGGMLAGKVASQVNHMAVGGRRTWAQIGYGTLYILPLVALFVVFQYSNANPRYQIYVENSLQEIIRMETRLVPGGVSEEVIGYNNIRVIEGKMKYSSWSGDRYFLRVVTLDWETMEVGQGGRGDDPELLYQLANDFAGSTGAKLDLGSKLPQFR